MKCPHCDGRGANRAITCGAGKCQMVNHKCSTCNGTGQIDEDRQAKIEAGKIMKRDRIRRNQTQREEAKRLGIDVVIYSQMERGIYDGEGETNGN